MILSDQTNHNKISTKFGTAEIDSVGYYKISSNEYGKKHEHLHRVLFEEFYNIKIPKGYVIHHKNGNKLDNCILNLQLMKLEEHIKLHNSGENSYWHNNHHTIKTRIKMSQDRNTSGYYNVVKEYDSNYKQGFCWKYRYYKDNIRKCLKSRTIDELKEKVIANGLEWFEFEKEVIQ